MNEHFEVRVTKDSLVFSAAHFITFNGNVCERLHGHNWRVNVVVAGDLDENFYVFDFIALRDTTQALVNELDHKVLLPDRHAQIAVSVSDDGLEVEARHDDLRWVFPVGDCCILPVANTTAELIACWFGRQLCDRLELVDNREIQQLRVGIEENFGQWATVSLDVS